jgi:biotin transport system substrate-specific component
MQEVYSRVIKKYWRQNLISFTILISRMHNNSSCGGFMAVLTKKKRIAETFSFLQSFSFNQEIISVLQILFASYFIGICAQIKIPLYFTPVPLAGATFAVMLSGALLGSRKGALAVLCYLIQGWIGLPVWAGGAAGFAHFIGPTGGYLTAYILQAYFIGWFLQAQSRMGQTKIISVLLLSICLQMSVGALWLAQFVGIKHCFMCGFYPFIPGEVAKAFLVAAYLRFRDR